MSGKVVGTYLKRVELVEGSTEMMEILKAITVHDPWQWPYEADSPLRDYLRCYKKCLEHEFATDCAQQTEEELLKRLPKAGYAIDIIKHELDCRWEKQFADASYDQLYAIASGDHPAYKTEWLGLHLDALEAETRTSVRKLSVEAIHHRVANMRGSEPKKAALFETIASERCQRQQERQRKQSTFAQEKAALDGMTLPDLIDIQPRYSTLTPEGKRYRRKRIRKHAMSETDLSELLSIDFWAVAEWVEDEKLGKHRVGATYAKTDEGGRKWQKFYDRAILADMQDTSAYLLAVASAQGDKLPADKHRLMLAHGIQDPNDEFVEEYCELCEKWSKETGAT